MTRRLSLVLSLALAIPLAPVPAPAEPIAFKMLPTYSRATFKADAQLETDNQKRWGFTTDNLKVRAKFATTLSDHGIPVPQILLLKLSNDILLETDLTFVKQ